MLQLDHADNFEILMGFYWSPYKLSNLKEMIEDKLEQVKDLDSNLDLSQKIALLEVTKQAFLLNMSGLGTKKFKNTQLNQLKTDLINLYDELCVLLKKYQDAQETKLFLDHRQQTIKKQKSSSSYKEALKLEKAAPSSQESPSSTDIVFQYTKTLLQDTILNDKITDPLQAATRALDIYREHAASGHGTGVFGDIYHRAGYRSYQGEQSSLAYLSCVLENESDPSMYKYVYSHAMDEILKTLFTLDELSFEDPEYLEGNLVGYLIAAKTEKKSILEFLGLIGALPPRDTMLQIYSRRLLKEANNKPAALLPKICKLISERHKKDFEPTSIKTYEYSGTNLDSLIRELKGCLNNAGLEEMNQFYYQATLNLLIGLKELSPLETPDTLSAINRIVHLIKISKYCEYNQFIDCISLIWDEIRWLAKPNEMLSRDERIELYFKTINTLKTYSTYLSNSTPAAVSLGTSCMNVIVRSIYCALKQLTQDGKKIALRTGKNNYFEIISFLRLLLKFKDLKPELEKNVYTDGNKSTDIPPENWPTNLIHLYINTIEANVLTNSAGFEYTHVNDFIEEQLELRTRLSNTDPLICIFDMTMGYMNDVFIKWIVEQFKEAIAKGQVYIFFTHSLNKFWGMGLDKGSAGFCHQYGNLDYFPFINKKSTEFNFGGYLANSSTVSFIELIMSRCPELSDTYFDLIRSRSRFIFDHVLNSIVNTKKSYILIDDPKSYPLLKDKTEPLMDLSNSSTFVTLRVNPKYTPKTYFSRLFISCANELLLSINIQGRDGYGFAKSSYCNINPPNAASLIRISIGGESLETLTINFRRISNFILQFNKDMENYLPLIQKKPEEFDSAITILALRKLARSYLEQYPKDEYFAAKYQKIEIIIQNMAQELYEAPEPLDEIYDRPKDPKYKP